MFINIETCAKPSDQLKTITKSDNKYMVQKDPTSGHILLTPILDTKKDHMYTAILDACMNRLRFPSQPDSRHIDRYANSGLFLAHADGRVIACAGVWPDPAIVTQARYLADKAVMELPDKNSIARTPKKASGDLLAYPIIITKPDDNTPSLGYIMGFMRPNKTFDFTDTPELSMTADILTRYIRINNRKD